MTHPCLVLVQLKLQLNSQLRAYPSSPSPWYGTIELEFESETLEVNLKLREGISNLNALPCTPQVYHDENQAKIEGSPNAALSRYGKNRKRTMKPQEVIFNRLHRECPLL